MPQAVGLAELESRVAFIRKRFPAYGEAAHWVGELLALTMSEPPPALSALSLTSEQTGDKFTGGQPLLEPGDLPLDLEAARRLLKKLLDKLTSRKASREQALALARLLAEGGPDLPRLCHAVLAGDRPAQEEAAQELGLDPQVLNLVLLLALRPSLLATAQSLAEAVDLKRWEGGHCPVCGSAPRLAHLEGDGGKRVLHCSLCETAWTFRRLSCPFCDNQDPDKLVVLLPEGQEGLRVDLCQACGQYVKTLDLRSLAGPVIPLLDDLATWHLDLVAKRHQES